MKKALFLFAFLLLPAGLWAQSLFGFVNQGYGSTETTIQLVAGQGANFPIPGPSGYLVEWYDYTLYWPATNDPNYERVLVTALSGDRMTIVRGQNGTTANTHNNPGDRYVVHTVTAYTPTFSPTPTATPTFTSTFTATRTNTPGPVTIGNAVAVYPTGTWVVNVGNSIVVAFPTSTPTPTPTPTGSATPTPTATTNIGNVNVTNFPTWVFPTQIPSPATESTLKAVATQIGSDSANYLSHLPGMDTELSSITTNTGGTNTAVQYLASRVPSPGPTVQIVTFGTATNTPTPTPTGSFTPTFTPTPTDAHVYVTNIPTQQIVVLTQSPVPQFTQPPFTFDGSGFLKIDIQAQAIPLTVVENGPVTVVLPTSTPTPTPTPTGSATPTFTPTTNIGNVNVTNFPTQGAVPVYATGTWVVNVGNAVTVVLPTSTPTFTFTPTGSPTATPTNTFGIGNVTAFQGGSWAVSLNAGQTINIGNTGTVALAAAQTINIGNTGTVALAAGQTIQVNVATPDATKSAGKDIQLTAIAIETANYPAPLYYTATPTPTPITINTLQLSEAAPTPTPVNTPVTAKKTDLIFYGLSNNIPPNASTITTIQITNNNGISFIYISGIGNLMALPMTFVDTSGSVTWGFTDSSTTAVRAYYGLLVH